MSKLHQLTAVQSFHTHHQPDYRDYRDYAAKGRLLRSRFWWRVFSAIGRSGQAVLHTLIYQHRRRQALRELYRLDDHTLLDIGIDRSRINDTVDNLLQSEQQQQRLSPAVVTITGYRQGAVAVTGKPACNDEPRRRVVNG